MTYGPDKNALYPNEAMRSVCYIKNLPPRPNVEIGDFTYYSDPHDSPENFYDHVEFHYPFMGDRLIIGKFCAIAEGVRFIMNGAAHRMNGLTTYPFSLFGGGWEKTVPEITDLPYKGDTVLGNDVWLGLNVTVMPGVTIGDGAIVAANSTVVKNVEPYSIVGGNPAKLIRMRFEPDMVEALQRLRWWDWDEKKIFDHLETLVSADSLETVLDLMRL